MCHCSLWRGQLMQGGGRVWLRLPAHDHFMPHVSTTGICFVNKSKQHFSEEDPQLLQMHFTFKWLAVPRQQIKWRKSDNSLAVRTTVFPPLIWRQWWNIAGFFISPSSQHLSLFVEQFIAPSEVLSCEQQEVFAVQHNIILPSEIKTITSLMLLVSASLGIPMCSVNAGLQHNSSLCYQLSH